MTEKGSVVYKLYNVAAGAQLGGNKSYLAKKLPLAFVVELFHFSVLFFNKKR